MELLFKQLTGTAIKAYYKVFNTLGYGFLEKVYENAMGIELSRAGLNIKKQFPVTVYYEGIEVGYYIADLIIENSFIIEIKAMESLREEHEFQLINYLRATNIEVGLLMNFGKKAEYRRKIFMNERKISP
ncbi:MAG: GxxExxY protein [Bacteroidota bacterium]|nr:GxxExxY protein [Bacteroidota bacterium]